MYNSSCTSAVLVTCLQYPGYQLLCMPGTLHDPQEDMHIRLGAF